MDESEQWGPPRICIETIGNDLQLGLNSEEAIFANDIKLFKIWN